MVTDLDEAELLEASGIDIIVGQGMEVGGILRESIMQMGAAFSTCFESGANPLYKKILLSQISDQTMLAGAFLGRCARRINN